MISKPVIQARGLSCGPTVGLVSDAAGMGDAVSKEDNGADGGEDVVGNNIGGEDADGGEDVAGINIGDVGDAAGDAVVDAAPSGEPLHTYMYWHLERRRDSGAEPAA